MKLLAVVVLLAALMIGATPATALTPSASAPVIAFVGDSNETLAMPAVDDLLPPEFEPVDVTRVGAGIRGLWCGDEACFPNLWPNKMRVAFLDQRPDAYVMNLGINDAAGPGQWNTLGYSYYGYKIDWLMSFTHDKPVFWTNLPCAVEPVSRQPGCAVVNRALAAAAFRHPNLTVLDWSSLATANPSWIGGFGGVHLTSDGQVAWAQFVQSALREEFDT